MKRKLPIASLAVLILLSTACLHKSGGHAITPMERVAVFNAELAQANETLEQGAEAVVSSGLVPVSQAAPIIGLSGQIAIVHQQITAIIATGAATQPNVTSVAALIDQIKASGSAIPPTALGFKNPKSQQTFQADFNSIYSLADTVLTSLKAVHP